MFLTINDDDNGLVTINLDFVSHIKPKAVGSEGSIIWMQNGTKIASSMGHLKLSQLIIAKTS